MGLLRLFVMCGYLCTAAALQAALLPAGSYFQEVGGVVVGEAENFHARTGFSATETWKIAPDEVIAGDNAVPVLNPRGGKYIQALADGTVGGGGPNVAPTIEYRINITNPGNYQLFLRWDANGSANSGTSDSMYADIVELKDGTSGTNTIADWYLYGAPSTDGDFNSGNWDGLAGKELMTNGAEANASWVIATPGIYTLRFSQREDGAAVDAWVFTSGVGPTSGIGPAESQVIPEPTAIALLLPIGLAAVWIGKRRSP